MEEDLDLIEAYLSGNDGAIEKLVLKYQKQVYGLIYRMVHDMESAKDLTQQTFLNVVKGIRGFRKEASFKTWLYQIASNTSLNHLRQHRHEEIELDESFAGNATGVLSGLIEKEKRDQIRQGLDGLPERQRLALVLRAYEGLTCAEAARVMGCSEGAVKAHYHLAVQKLRVLFKEKGYEVRS